MISEASVMLYVYKTSSGIRLYGSDVFKWTRRFGYYYKIGCFFGVK